MPVLEPLSEGGGEARGVLGRRTAGGAGCVRRGVVSSVAVVAERSEWWSSMVAGLLGLTWDGEGRTTTEGMSRRVGSWKEVQRCWGESAHSGRTLDSDEETGHTRHRAPSTRDTRNTHDRAVAVGDGSHRAKRPAAHSPKRPKRFNEAEQRVSPSSAEAPCSIPDAVEQRNVLTHPEQC